MKRKLIVLILILSLFLGSGGVILAQNNDQLPDPGLTPDSPFYFLKMWRERIVMFFTFSPQSKVERALSYSQEKMAEFKLMAQEGKIKATEKARREYENYLNKANRNIEKLKARGKNVEELVTKVSEATFKHKGVLQKVYEKVPDKAKEAILKAMEASMKGHERALEAISGVKKKIELEERNKEMLRNLNNLKERLRIQKKSE